MANPVFHKAVGYTPAKGPVGWHAEPSDEPQSFPEEFVAYPAAAGAATRVDGKGEEPEPVKSDAPKK